VPFGTASRVVDRNEPDTPQLRIFWRSTGAAGLGAAVPHTGLPDTVKARLVLAAWNVRPFTATVGPFRLIAL
jgi:hypothetical protein